MSFYVIKRDGRKVEYKNKKIKDAVYKAAKATAEKKGEDFWNFVANNIVEEIEDNISGMISSGLNSVNVETLQDIVEYELMENRHYEIAKNYILYRKQHEKYRDAQKLYNGINDTVNNYLDLSNWKVNENSNMGYSLQGLNNHIASEVTGHYWLNEIYPKHIKEKHVSGDLHIHDLANLSNYCCGWDLQDLLLEGFSGVSTKIESAPPKHFRTALGQMVNFLYTLQGESSGAQAFSSFDTYLAPFVSYDGLDYDEVYQAMQEFIFNLNVPTRVGFQSPFTNLTMDLVCPSNMAEDPAIIGGEMLYDMPLKNFQKEMDMINKAFAEVMLAGDSKGRVFSFPIPTYNITPDFDWDNEILNPVWEMTAKYGIPYFANFVNSDMKAEDARSMCPLDGKEKVLVKTGDDNVRYSQINHTYYDTKDNDDILVYSDGKFIEGRFNKFENQNMINVRLVNGHEIKMTEEHLNFVIKNKNKDIEEMSGKDLKEGYYLPYSLTSFKGEGGTYDLGYLIGAFAGDGSCDKNTGTVFSLNNNTKLTVLENLKEILTKLFGAKFTEKEEKNNVVKLSTYNPAVKSMIESFVDGDNALNKYFKANVFEMSKHFRTGLFDGYYETDGGNKNRIYTSSEKMVESLNMLAATLGTTTNVYTDDRKKSDGRLGDNPNYAVLFYKLNRNSYGDVWFKKDSKLWMKIDKVEKLKEKQTAYCFEVKDGEPMFTVGTTGILTHNCRLRLDNRQLRKRGGGLFGSSPMTGSIGVVTLNMPRIGLLAENTDDYLERVYELMDIAKESLEIKRRILEELTDAGLYPYSKFYLRSIKERFGEYWKNHFNTIGLNGMNESVMNFLGKDMTEHEAIKFTKWVMHKMKERMVEYQEETSDLFNLEATPAEGTSYRLAKSDLDKFGKEEAVFANDKRVYTEDADPYYTNSTQLPVGATDDPFEALDWQDELQKNYTGGTVLHLFLGERMPGIEATKKFVKRVAENYELPYYSITPTFSICPIHGYLPGEHEFCPKCDAENGYEG
jgi:ribonucleoside-triphosphate reductase